MTLTHYWNRLTLKGDADTIRRLREDVRMKGKPAGSFSFDAVTPRPDWVKCELTQPEEPNRFYDSLITERKQWVLTHWGVPTFPLFIGHECPSDAIEFYTINHAVPKMVSKFSKLAPDCEVIYEFASEDWEISGRYTFKGDELIMAQSYPPKSREAEDLSVELWSGGK